MTEGMDRIDRIVKSIDGSKMRTAAKGNLRKWCAEYAWASEFVYGIEKDYRLAKTAKVSCFLNGDGEANMILGDGLDNFSLSQEYTGKLLNTALPPGERDNPQFDVVAANPPYSVGACKKTIRHGEKSFTLWPRLTDASSEIECLFVERAKQVLKPGGVAGLLLPTSILSNGGIHEAARDILLRYFQIKAIAVMGSGTFMATGTNTVILFMQRRENDEHARIGSLIERYFGHWLDMTVAGQEDAFALYARSVWNVDLAVFSALLRGDDTAPAHALLSSYRQAFDELAEIRTLREKNRQFKALSALEQAAQLETRFRAWLCGREKEKILIFFLVNGQSVVLARAPSEKNAEKAFLGYEFSNRKGAEGLKILSGTGHIETALYSETNDADPEKINTLIRQNFLGNTPAVPKVLAKFVDVVPLADLINFDQVRFDKVIGTSAKKKALSGRWPLVPLTNFLELNPPKPKPGNIPDTETISFIDMPSVIEGGGVSQILPRPYAEVRRGGYTHFRGGDVLFAKITPCMENGKSALLESLPTSHGFGSTEFHVLRARNIETAKLVYQIIRTASFRELMAKKMTGASGHRRVPPDAISGYQVPDLPLPLIGHITRHLSKYDLVEATRTAQIQAVAQPLFTKIFAITARRHIGDFCTLASERVDPGDAPGNDFNYIGLEHISEGTGESTWAGPCKGATIKSTKNVFRKGDVLYGKLRPYLNKVWIAEFDGVCTTEMLVLKPSIPATLLKYLLLSPAFVEQAKAKMGGVSLPRIKPGEVMLIPVPDVGPQVTKLSKIASEIETERQRQQAKLARLRIAKQAYLDKWLS